MIKEPDHEKEFFADLLLMRKVDRKVFEESVNEMDSKKIGRFLAYVAKENAILYSMKYTLLKLQSFLNLKKKKKDGE